MTYKTSILLADDHLLFISGLSTLLAEEQNNYDISVAHDGNMVLQMVSDQQPDIILLDIGMPGIGGMEVLKYMNRVYPAIKIIMLSSYNDAHLIEKARRAGASGYLLKNCSIEELQRAIADVMEGKLSFPPIVHLPEHNAYTNPIAQQFNLTKREIEIIQLIKEELTNKQIADKLFLSLFTVETHRKNIMHKLKLNSAVSLMKFILDFKL